MARTAISLIAELFARRKRHEKYLLVTGCLAVVVAVGVSLAFRRIGMTITTPAQDDAGITESVETHVHTDACYDENGALVCELPEFEAGDGSEDESVSTSVDSEDEAAEDMTDGNLSSDEGLLDDELAEDEASPDNDGLDDESVAAADSELDDSEQDAPSPDLHFDQDFEDEQGNHVLTVTADVPAGALPDDATMEATWIEPDELSDKTQAAVEDALATKTDGQTRELQAVDIIFRAADGTAVEPTEPVVVTLTSGLIDTDDQPIVVHVDDLTEAEQRDMSKGAPEPDRTAEVVDILTERQLDKREMELESDQVAYEETNAATSVLAVTTLEKVMEASDGESYTVTVDAPARAGVRQSDELEVTEICEGDERWSECVSQVIEATGAQPRFLRLFDIRIVDEEGSKVDIASPVDVRVELNDADELSEGTRAVHMGDDGVEVLDASVEGGLVSFVANGFSAYAIVDGPDPVEIVVDGIADLNELASVADEGKALYLSLPALGSSSFCSSELNKNSAFVEVASAGAAEWYFEPTGTANEYRIYTLEGTTKRYIRNTSGNLVGLTENLNQASVFEISQATDSRFNIKLKGADKWLQHSGSGSGIRFWTDINNANNSRFEITTAESYQAGDDPYELDGTTIGLMRWDGTAMGKALMASSSSSGSLDALPLTVMTHKENDEDKLFIPADSGATMWTFEWVEGDHYYLKATENGVTSYLAIGQDGLSLVSSPEQCTPIKVVPGTGAHAGQISLQAGGTTLTYTGKQETGFKVHGDAGTEWLYFVQESELTDDYFMTYTAKKVSVSDPDVTTGTKLVVYTRIWNESTLKYEFYAIDHDGSLLRCYENGDQIQWVGSEVNTLLWEFTEYRDAVTQDINYYYELYNQYAEKYLAPLSSTGQILSDETVGINLNGRRDGKYYTSIVAWDDGSYAYSGITTDDGHTTIESCPKSDAIDFYFAVVEEKQADEELTTVATLDNDLYGIKMRIRDFDSREQMTAMMGHNNTWTGDPEVDNIKNLLSRELDEYGYPTTMGGNNLGSYFADATEVNHLFIESIYGSSGYYVYDSAQNFASLQEDGNFKVYKEIGTYDSAGNKPTLKHGQFFPFNDIKAGQFATVNGKNQYGVDAQPLPDSDPRKNERLYLLQSKNGSPGKANTYFAMELEASFVQTPSGLDDWGHDIIYEFTGDDDFWLYVDGQLVIDLGGIHSAMPGTVNFATGAVSVNGHDTTLRAIFEENYRIKNPTASEADVTAYLDDIFKDGGTVFKDNTTHTMKIFYMERGAGASNLNMRFNLSSIRPGSVLLSKELDGVDKRESVAAEYPYQIFYTTADEPNVEKQVDAEPGTTSPKVMYKDSNKTVSYRHSLTVGGTTYDKVFMLKPTEIAEIQFPDNTISYRVVECGVNTNVYDHVYVNTDEVAGTPRQGTYADYGVEFDDPKTNAMVAYKNHVQEDALRTVSFKKQLYEADGETPIPYDPDDPTTFNFRLSFGSEFDDELTLANMHTYHVKNPDGFYCTWDAGAQKFVPLPGNKSDYSSLTDAEKEQASFTTSMNGAIASIPNGFTVELREVLVGTQYKVEERSNELPDGYSLQGYVLNDAVDESGKPDIKTNPITESVHEDEDPHIEVRNLKGYGLRVNKTWIDQDYMASRDPAYFAVFVDKGSGPELVEGSIRQMTFDENTLYWYYLTLPEEGTRFEDYTIYEVTLTNPVVNQDGVVTSYHNLKYVVESGQQHHEAHSEEFFHINGTQKGETTSSQLTYTVEYERGSVRPGSNVRVDEAVNKRPGIVIHKTDWEGEPLAGATFELRDESGTLISTFTSDEQGNATVAFLRPTVTYTLTETAAPKGHCGLPADMTIEQAHSGAVTVGGVSTEWYDIQQTLGAQGHRELTIKDRPFTLEVVKVDEDNGQPLSGVQFSLNKVVVVDDMTTTRPMAGYEDLVTDESGVVPQVDATLAPATYELQELAPKDGYIALSSHLRFNISDTGVVTLMKKPEGTELTTTIEDDGTQSYRITIPNRQNGKVVQFTKVDVANPETKLTGAVFDLYEVDDQGVKKQNPSIDITGLVSDANGVLTQDGSNTFVLPLGTYHLVETEAPTGYNKLDGPIAVFVNGEVTARQADSQSDVTHDEATDVWQVTVWNSPGVELPYTGGPGVVWLYVLGVVMIACGGFILARKGILK